MDSYTGKDLIFIAGGIGLIPLRSCIKYALEKKDKYRKIQLFYGARTPKDLMFLDELPVWEKQGLEYYLTVDKGDDKWPHAVGVVGALLKKPEVKIDVANSIAFVCGPPVMFRFVIKDLLNLGFDPNNIVSTLERYMKCGLGKCGHCCIGVAYVCVDGPVFTYEQIRKLGEDI
jgi:NAD(P)H-flavin reductase